MQLFFYSSCWVPKPSMQFRRGGCSILLLPMLLITTKQNIKASQTLARTFRKTNWNRLENYSPRQQFDKQYGLAPIYIAQLDLMIGNLPKEHLWNQIHNHSIRVSVFLLILIIGRNMGNGLKKYLTPPMGHQAEIPLLWILKMSLNKLNIIATHFVRS